MGSGHNAALMSLIADLPAGQEELLLHVLECEICRGETVACCKREKKSAEKELLAGRLQELERRVQEAEAMVTELLALSPGQRSAAVRQPRFHSGLIDEAEPMLRQAARCFGEIGMRDNPERGHRVEALPFV